MNTRMLMGASGAAMVGGGIAGTFLSHEILVGIGVNATGVIPVVVQLHAALLMGFGALNWMAKDSLIGGIYNRPVAVGNLLHFATGAITLIKVVAAGPVPMPVLAAALLYALFAAGFGLVVFRSPVQPVPLGS